MIWKCKTKNSNQSFRFIKLEETKDWWTCRIYDPNGTDKAFFHGAIYQWRADWMEKNSQEIKETTHDLKFESKSGKKMETRIIKCQ